MTTPHAPGTLHTGGVVPGTEHTEPVRHAAGFNTEPGVAAPGTHTHTERNTSTYDAHSSDTHTQREVPVPVAAFPHSGHFSLNNSARGLLALTQLLTAASFFVVLGGLIALQKRRDDLALAGPQAAAYTEIFQSANQVPYVNDGHHQFGLAWWILSFEVVIALIILVLLITPRRLLRLKHVAMAFLVYVFVLTTLEIESLYYFRRTAAANALFGRRRILVTLIGTIAGAICNGLSIIFLGLLRNKYEFDDYHNNHGRRAGKRVGADNYSHVGSAAV